jgi:hypothetical protein
MVPTPRDVRFSPKSDRAAPHQVTLWAMIRLVNAAAIPGHPRIGPADGYRARNVGTRVIASARAAGFVPV